MPRGSASSSRVRASTSSRSRRAASSRMRSSRRSAGPSYPYTGQSGYECMPTIYSDARGPFAPQRAARRDDPRRGPRRRARRRRSSLPAASASSRRPKACSLRGEADLVASARQSLADPDWFQKIRAGPRRRDPALRVHELLRGARPAAQAGDLQAVGSRGARRARCHARDRRQAPAGRAALAALTSGTRLARFLLGGRP